MAWLALSGLIRFDLDEDREEVRLRLAGELDLLSSGKLLQLTDELASRSPSRILVDLSRVTFLDASGISLLVLAGRRVRDRGGELVLRRPHRAVRRLLEIFGSDLGLRVEDGPSWSEPAPEVVAVCAAAVDAAMACGGATMGHVQLSDAGGGLHFVASENLPRSVLDFFEVVTDSECTSGAAWAVGHAIYVADVTTSRIFLGRPSLEVLVDAHVRSVGSLLLRDPAGRPVGVLSVESDRAGRLSRGQRRLLRRVADEAGRRLGESAAGAAEGPGGRRRSARTAPVEPVVGLEPTT